MRILSCVLSVLIVLLVACASPESTETGDNEFRMLAEHVKSRMGISYNCSAGGALVMQGGELVFEEYYGTLAARDSSAPVDSASRFPFYSISKGFGAGVLASLVSRGALSLDDPVSKFLPHFTGAGPGGKFDRGAMTVRHLASHSSGVPQDDTPPRTWPEGEEFSDVVLEFEPGTSFLYSELAMRLLGRVMAEAGGMPYEELLKAYITGPLGLNSVGYLNHGGDLTHIVETGVGLDTSRVFYSDEFGKRPYPGSGLYGNLRDIARYAQAWVVGGETPEGRKIWETNYQHDAWENQPPEREPDPAYGQLFWLFPQVQAAVFSGAAHTICCILPDHDMVLVMGLNQRQGNPGWDFESEKINLARIGHAILARHNWKADKGM